MILSILEFFKKEKKYTLLSALCIGIFLYILMGPGQAAKKSEETPELQKFKAAEQLLQKEVQEKGSLETYLKEHPALARQIAGLSFFMLAALGTGTVFIIFWLTRPEWRRSLGYDWGPSLTPWSYGMIYKVVILFIFFSFVTGLGLAGLRHIGGNDSSNFYILMHTTVMDILCFFFVRKVVLDAGGTMGEIGFRIPEKQPLRETFFAWGAYAAILPIFALILLAVLAVASLIQYEPPAHPLVNVFLEEESRAKPLIAYSIFLAVVIGPLFEEIFFRGFCYTVLKHKVGIRGAMIITSAFFALIHENTFAFWPIFALGMVLCYVYEKRGSLLAPMVLHVTHNAIFIYYFFVAKDLVGLVQQP